MYMHHNFSLIPPCAKEVISIKLNLQFLQKSTFLRSKKDFLKKALRMEWFQKYFFYTTFHHHFLGQKCKNFTHIPFWPGKQWSDLSYSVQIGLLFTIIFNIMSIPESHPTFVQTQELSIEVFHWKHQCFFSWMLLVNWIFMQRSFR